MIRRSTLVLIVVFAALAAGAFFWQRAQENQAPTAAATPGNPPLFTFTGKITGLRLERANGGVLELERDAQDAWRLIYPKADDTDTATVESAMSQLITAQVLSSLEEGPSLEAAGLAPPVYRLLLNLDDGSQAVMNIGNANPTGSGYYVLVNQQGMKIVSKYSLESLLKLLDNPPILPTPSPEAGSPTPPEGSVTPAP